MAKIEVRNPEMPAHRQYTRHSVPCAYWKRINAMDKEEKPTGGQIIFDGEDITKLEGAKLQPYHKRMQIIFQDPYSALDPHHKVEEIIREPMSLYTNASKSDIDEQIVELLKKVGMNMKESCLFLFF